MVIVNVMIVIVNQESIYKFYIIIYKYNVTYMGYKYGIWLVYKNYKDLSTKHIGHITLSCFMSIEDAINLHKDLILKFGKFHFIKLKKEFEFFQKNYYKNDNNNIYSWGFIGETYIKDLWEKFKGYAYNYNCSFSDIIHTSINYNYNNELLIPYCLKEDLTILCSLEVIDITSDNPNDWHIIE